LVAAIKGFRHVMKADKSILNLFDPGCLNLKERSIKEPFPLGYYQARSNFIASAIMD